MNGIGIGGLPVMSTSLSKMNGSLMLSAMNNGSMLGTPSSVRIGAGSRKHSHSHQKASPVVVVDATFSPMSGNSPGMCGHIGEQPNCLTTNGEIGTYGAVDNSPNRGGESPVPLSRLRLFVVVYKVIPDVKPFNPAA